MKFHNCFQQTNFARSFENPITFLEVLLYALTVKGEGMIVSKSKPTLRVILNGHTFNADPLSISTIGTLAPMHSMVICMSGSFWRKLFIEKGKKGMRWGLDPHER